ncbi:MAG: multicopper oxidase domain-containing protein, partial [Nevskiaceae bacterium]|nr:multicopper oxidase domain-containing protein [Nevskiaceae bacterium]
MIRRFARRAFLRDALRAAGALSLAQGLPGWARSANGGAGGHDHGAHEEGVLGVASVGGGDVLSGEEIDLTIGASTFRTAGRNADAVTINGTLPGPLLRLREGQMARIRVHNTLAQTTS